MIPIASDLDASGTMNTSAGMFATRKDADSIDWISAYDKALIMSEFGGDAALWLPWRHRCAVGPRSIRKNLYQHQIAMLKRIPFLRGMTRGFSRIFVVPPNSPRLQDFFNRKGLVSDHGEKKKAFFVLQKFLP